MPVAVIEITKWCAVDHYARYGKDKCCDHFKRPRDVKGYRGKFFITNTKLVCEDCSKTSEKKGEGQLIASEHNPVYPVYKKADA